MSQFSVNLKLSLLCTDVFPLMKILKSVVFQVVIYANTCADWMMTSIACFKHSLAIATIYTNLGTCRYCYKLPGIPTKHQNVLVCYSLCIYFYKHSVEKKII